MIHRIRLQRFKNFRDATLDLGPLTMIVGTNASGKSNLRDAFRFLHGMARDYSLADIVGDKYVDGSIQWKGIRGGSREIASFGQASFALTTSVPWEKKSSTAAPGNYVHELRVAVLKGSRPLRVMRESLHRNVTPVYHSHPLGEEPIQTEPENILVRLGHQSKEVQTLRFMSDQPVISQFESHDEVPEELRGYAKHALNQMRSMRFLDPVPEMMKQPSFPGQPLGDRGENLSSVLQAICEEPMRKLALTEWIRELTPMDVIDLEFVPEQTGKILVNLVESNGQKTSAYSASDGTLCFLAIVAALMGQDAAQLYFLEEIDAGIHPTRLSLLLQLIEQHTRQEKVQVVATTHSPQVLAMLSLESRENAVLVYRLENEAEAHIQRIMDIPSVRDVLNHQNLARLHETGWLENVMAFSQPEGAEA